MNYDVQTSSAPDVDRAGGKVPRHVAVIMDGNNRWAKLRGLPGTEGHRAGEHTAQSTIEEAVRHGIPFLTLFAFSSENWRRPEEEVDALMTLFLNALTNRIDELDAEQVRVRFIGDLSAFSGELRQRMMAAESRTRHHRRLTVSVAVNYGGQWDIAQAARALAEQVASGEIQANEITAARFGEHVMLADIPPPDLCIRTGGELRISNFLLWQCAYSEFYFTETLWPDFTPDEFAKALQSYQARQRRFGRTGEQLQPV